MAGRFEYAQAEEVRDAFARHGVRYLFLGKSGAILLGFPDTTQDADLFVEKSEANGAAVVEGLRELGFTLTSEQAAEIRRGKDFVQLKMAHSTWTWSSHPTESRRSPMRGDAAWRWKDSRSVIRPTSLRASRQPTESKIARRCRACGRFSSIGPLSGHNDAAHVRRVFTCSGGEASNMVTKQLRVDTPQSTHTTVLDP
jgi:hypothetical protein